MGKRVGPGGAGVPPAGCLEMENRSKKNMFLHDLPSSGAAGSRTSGSRAMLVQKVLRPFLGPARCPSPWRGWKPHLPAGTFSMGRDALPRVRGGVAPEGSRDNVDVLGGPRFVAAARTGCFRHVPEESCGHGPDEAGPSRDAARYALHGEGGTLREGRALERLLVHGPGIS